MPEHSLNLTLCFRSFKSLCGAPWNNCRKLVTTAYNAFGGLEWHSVTGLKKLN